MSRRKKQGSGVILTVLMYQRKAAETHLVKALTATGLFLGKHPKINNPISGLVRIISTAALPLQHLVARRQSSERVCTFKNTICMSLSQSFYHRASCADGQESRTCNKCPHKGHERVESWRKVRPVFIPLLSSQVPQHCDQALHLLWSHFPPAIPIYFLWLTPHLNFEIWYFSLKRLPLFCDLSHP